METIYLRTLELLAPETLPDEPKEMEVYNQLKKIQWVDMDKGQIDFYEMRPPIPFPCALVSIELPRTENKGNNVQMCLARVTVRLAFDYMGGTTNSAVLEQHRLKSLEYFQLVNAVYLAMQGKTGVNHGKFDRVSVELEKRPDNLTVVLITFTTSFLDRSAATPSMSSILRNATGA